MYRRRNLPQSTDDERVRTRDNTLLPRCAKEAETVVDPGEKEPYLLLLLLPELYCCSRTNSEE